MLVCHVNRRGSNIHQRIPFPFDIVGAKYEHKFMGILGRLTDADWLYRHRITRKLMDWMANRLVLPFVHGEVLTPDEIENMVRRLESEDHVMALGICECRHGEGKISVQLEDGRDPNYTCVMIGDWGRAHLYTYPQHYRPVTADELIELARFWHRRGRVLTSWGCSTVHGFLVSYCHCLPYYCVPFRNQLQRGNKVFLEGYSYAVIDPQLCLSPQRCEWNCVSRCHFGAIGIEDGKAVADPALCYGCGLCFCHCPSGAATAVRRKGHRLYFTPPELVEGR